MISLKREFHSSRLQKRKDRLCLSEYMDFSEGSARSVPCRMQPGEPSRFRRRNYGLKEDKELGKSKDDPFALPDQIGTYKLTNLGANCFENNLLKFGMNGKME